MLLCSRSAPSPVLDLALALALALRLLGRGLLFYFLEAGPAPEAAARMCATKTLHSSPKSAAVPMWPPCCGRVGEGNRQDESVKAGADGHEARQTIAAGSDSQSKQLQRQPRVASCKQQQQQQQQRKLLRYHAVHRRAVHVQNSCTSRPGVVKQSRCIRRKQIARLARDLFRKRRFCQSRDGRRTAPLPNGKESPQAQSAESVPNAPITSRTFCDAFGEPRSS